MFLQKILNNFSEYSNEIAFCIKDKFWTYKDFEAKIISIINYLKENNVRKNDVVIIYVTDDIETYASIFAVWFMGCTFVPLNPLHPEERNNLILNQIKYKLIISEEKTKNLSLNSSKIILPKIDKNDLMYIIFTSGSTGIPKGVKISFFNVEANFNNFLNTNFKLNNSDTFLQLYELTFDASIHAYLLPIYLGASVYTVPSGKVKYLAAYKIMLKHKITFAKLTPAILHYLKPYFNSIKLNSVKYNTLGGEELDKNLVLEWQKCLPNAEIYNLYGPTEATINTFFYKIEKYNIKSRNNIVSIGRPFGDTDAIIIDANNQVIKNGEIGEICLSGSQISSGYLNNKKLNQTSFFYTKRNNEEKRYYKTGDLAYIDDDGDFIFCGRLDNQIQIQGYRVELHEIEAVASNFDDALVVVALNITNRLGIEEIILYTENYDKNILKLMEYLETKLPKYMIPKEIVNISKFPHTTNGKIDKNRLKTIYNDK